MNFLDPDEWADLEALSKQYEELTDELVADLHGRLKPYFLRRIKSEVLQLPPKVRYVACLPVITTDTRVILERSHCSRQHGSAAERNLSVTPQ